MSDFETRAAAMKAESRKPLGGRAYGSIPHLPNSRLGPGDWSINPGQARIATERARDEHDRIIVTEKLDGSCCTVARIGTDILAVPRAGYLATTSPYVQHHHFAAWVERRRKRFLDLLQDGERVAGEWLLQAHGTRYMVAHPDDLFVAFDILVGKKRLLHDETCFRLDRAALRRAFVLSDGPSCAVEVALHRLRFDGFHDALEPVEGAVWRVERKGACDFLCKFVRLDKVDGRYLPELTGGEPVWNAPLEWAALREVA